MMGFLSQALNSTLFQVLLGAFLALAGSIFVLRMQFWKQEKEQHQQLLAMLLSIRDEIDSIWKEYIAGIGQRLEQHEEEKPFFFYYPVTQDYFTNYQSSAQFLGQVEDSDLRQKIIRVYTKA